MLIFESRFSGKTKAELLQRIADLELQLAKALKNSSNSSKSPSSDIVKPPNKKTDRRKKAKRGGQPGHSRKLREPLPPERVDEEITCEINADQVREFQLTPTDQFEIVQHVELLDLPIHITEHQLRKYLDADGKTVLPDVHEELKRAIPTQPQLGSDETSLKNNGKKHWAWCITAPLFTLFHIASSRSRAVLEELVGTDFKGYIFLAMGLKPSPSGETFRFYFNLLRQGNGKLPNKFTQSL